MPWSNIQRSIIATVIYRSVFKSKYNSDFYYNWLIKAPSNFQKTSNLKKFQEIFSSTLSKELTGFINSHKSSNENFQYNLKINIAHQYAKYLAYIPTIELVAVTGSVANFQPKEPDDIDIMIICKPKTLWITRFFVITLLEFYKKRRRPNDIQFKDKFCTNLFLDSDNLKVPDHKQNLYIAHELLHAIPIFQRNNIYQKYLISNQWAKFFLPKSYSDHLSLNITNAQEGHYLLVALFRCVEPFIHKFSMFFMSPRKGQETINKNQAYFHPHDYQGEIELAFQKALTSYKIDYHDFFFNNKKSQRTGFRQANS